MTTRDILRDIKTGVRALALLAGIGCLALFFTSETVWVEISWTSLAAALFLLVIALKD